MAEEKKPEGEAPKEPAKPKGPMLPMLVGILNIVATLAAVGVFVYTKILFKRPPITEEQERAKIEEKAKKEKNFEDSEKGAIELKSFTTNIKPSKLPIDPAKPDAENIRIHYLTVSMTLETRDSEKNYLFEESKPKFMDHLIQLLGKKSYEELGSVQGRFVLRHEIMELANKLVKEAIVTNVFFSEFIVN